MDDRPQMLKMLEDYKEHIQKMSRQYELRERQFQAMTEAKTIEVKLAQAHLARVVERENSLAEEVKILRAERGSSSKVEEILRQQLAEYKVRMDQTQETMQKSSEYFTKFKTELDGAVKRIKKLEGDNGGLRQQKDSLTAKIITLTDDLTKSQRLLEATNAQKATLEKLCRALQEERKLVRGGDGDEAVPEN